MLNIRFSLADKISMTIIVVGLMGILLVYYLSNSYREFAYEHHTLSIQQLAYLKINDLVDDLKTDSTDLAQAIELESDFIRDFRFNQRGDLVQQLDNQFYQYFATAGVIKLLKLYVFDTTFTLHAISSKGIKTGPDNALICPHLSKQALKRRNTDKLKPISGMCLYDNHPIFSVIVPFGGLNPAGYIQVDTDLAYSLQKMEHSMAMPIQINTVDEQLIYQSRDWKLLPDNKNHLSIRLPIVNENNTALMSISLISDMTSFNKEITEFRNRTMSLAFITTALTVFIVLFLLRKSTIPPLAKIHDALEKIHIYSNTETEKSRVLFEQLLEQIIQLRQKSKIRFSVMVLDLTHFNQINLDYGNAIGDELLLKVEQRLSSILRDSDLISWVGTDSPGHKLLPSGSKTQYRATIARLGGDEFGLLLPSAQTAEQAKIVAQRIVETLTKAFNIKGHKINIECKIGISIYPVNGEDEKMLIRNADKAMYKARSHNQAVFVFEADNPSGQH